MLMVHVSFHPLDNLLHEHKLILLSFNAPSKAIGKEYPLPKNIDPFALQKLYQYLKFFDLI